MSEIDMGKRVRKEIFDGTHTNMKRVPPKNHSVAKLNDALMLNPLASNRI